jgi:hypothetical protein
MKRLADEYHSVFGEDPAKDPACVHLQDGKRVAWATNQARRIETMLWAEAAARSEPTFTLGEGEHGAWLAERLPICPDCAVTISFNVMSVIGRGSRHDPEQVADAMIRLWTEVKERGEFFTSERSGIVPKRVCNCLAT